jgi:hypothetical protein
MTKTTSVISFSTSSSGLDFALEQKPWPKKNPAKFLDWLKEKHKSNISASNVINAFELFKSNCLEGGGLEVFLNVRLEVLTTPYSLKASWGDLSSNISLITETRKEFLAFELVTEKSVDFGEITSTNWNGDTYNENGDIVSPPLVTKQGRTAVVASPIYGVLEVEVVEQFYQHSLLISPREPTKEQLATFNSVLEELYASTAMLFCNKHIIIHKVEMPDDFSTCVGGYGGSTIPDDPKDPQAKTYAVNFEVFDYCIGDIIPSASIYISGPETSMRVSPGDTVNLLSGKYDITVTSDGYTPSDEDDLEENDSFTLAFGANASNEE